MKKVLKINLVGAIFFLLVCIMGGARLCYGR